MNYYLEISKKVEEFCSTTPSPDQRDNYLDCAKEVKDLHSEAIVLENEGVKSDDERVVKIYNEISKVIG